VLHIAGNIFRAEVPLCKAECRRSEGLAWTGFVKMAGVVSHCPQTLHGIGRPLVAKQIVIVLFEAHFRSCADHVRAPGMRHHIADFVGVLRIEGRRC